MRIAFFCLIQPKEMVDTNYYVDKGYKKLVVKFTDFHKVFIDFKNEIFNIFSSFFFFCCV